MRNLFIAALTAVLFAPGLAFAHSTGHESRTPAQCKQLPKPLRRACLWCVARPRKHHFHPDYPSGQRCRPSDGRP